MQYSKTLEIETEDGADLLLYNSVGLPVSATSGFLPRVPIYVNVEYRRPLVWDALAQKVGWTTAVGEVTEQHFSQARDDLFVRQLEHFFDCIENHTPPRISLQDGVEVLKIIEKVKQSHLLVKRVTL